MTVPTAFSELSTTAGTNSALIAGSSSPIVIDNHFQAVYAFIASVYANSGNGWASPYLTAANPSYTGTLTGGTGVVNLGSGQFYKAAGGNVGIGNSAPSSNLHIGNGAAAVSTLLAGNNSGTGGGAAHIVSNNGSPIIGIGNYSALLGGAYAGDSTLYFSGGLVWMDGVNERMRIDSAGNVGIGMSSFGTSAVGVLALKNATAPSSSPAGGGVLYVEAGALKYRGSSGTVTVLATA